MGTGNVEQAAWWAERAPSWLRAEQHVERVSGPLGQQAMDRLALRPGERVLDIGCGSGATTLELARRVAPGTVVGADIVPALVEEARRRAAAEAADVSFAVRDVEVDDLGDEAFDAAFSRFGVMFFADPVAAFANVGRALRPGGRLCFVCWQELFSNEWMFVPGAAVIGVTGVLPAMPEPGAPGPFALADPSHIRSVLDQAGLHDIGIEPVEHHVVLTEDDIPATVEATASVGAVREALVDADDALRTRALAAVGSALRERLDGGVVRLRAAGFVVRASRR